MGSRAWTSKTCHAQVTSWSTRKTHRLDKPRSSLLRSRSWTSPTRSRLATHLSALCAAAARCRYLQELRGSFTRCLHGWKRCGDVGQGHLLRADRRGRQVGRQEEVSQPHDKD